MCNLVLIYPFLIYFGNRHAHRQWLFVMVRYDKNVIKYLDTKPSLFAEMKNTDLYTPHGAEVVLVRNRCYSQV